MTNAMMTIFPYCRNGTWMFDDAAKGLQAEPFVCGMSEMITIAADEIPNAEAGIKLTFSADEFPGYQIRLELTKPEMRGNWYRCTGGPLQLLEEEGWLCPALFKYFPEAPKVIYARADPIQ